MLRVGRLLMAVAVALVLLAACVVGVAQSPASSCAGPSAGRIVGSMVERDLVTLQDNLQPPARAGRSRPVLKNLFLNWCGGRVT